LKLSGSGRTVAGSTAPPVRHINLYAY